MLITSSQALKDFMAKASSCPFITVDTEFLREKTYYPKLCLVQIGLPDKQAIAVDPLAGDIDLAPLFEVLKSPKILKIFHAARQDIEIFYRLMGAVPAPLFDTQIAAMVCGYGEQVGYENLVNRLTDASIDKSVQFTDWSYRPLSQKQIDYALGDVIHLVDIYEALSNQLKERGRSQWAEEEDDILSDPATYSNDPEDAWQRVKIKTNKPKVLATLRTLAAWRERTAQRKDIPKNWVMRDETLADMAAQAPRNSKQLAQIRGINADKADSRSAQEWLNLIAEIDKTNPSSWPKREKRKTPSPSVAACTELLKMHLRMTAAKYEVAARLIASGEDLERIAEGAQAGAPDVKALNGWRYDIYGRHAIELRDGKITIGLHEGQVCSYRVDSSMELYE